MRMNKKNHCLKSNITFLISLCALLLLFSVPSKLFFLLEGVILVGALVLSVRVNITAAAKKYNLKWNCLPYLIAVGICGMGICSFYLTWEPIEITAVIAGSFHLSKLVFVGITGLVIAAAGGYAAVWIARLAFGIFVNVGAQEGISFDLRACIASLRSYWHLYASFFAFLLITAASSTEKASYILRAVLAILVSPPMFFLFSGVWTRWMQEIKQERRGLKIYSLITAVGICLGLFEQIYRTPFLLNRLQTLAAAPFINFIIKPFFVFCAISSIWFVYCAVCFLFARLRRFIAEAHIFSGISKAERIVYPILVLATIGLAIFAFSQSNAFYGSSKTYDLIYTTDSPRIVKINAYFFLLHPINDLKQPLFAVFAAPFTGAAYLIGRLLPFSPYSWQLWMNIAQILLLFLGTYLLTRILELSPFQRLCFMALSCCSYSYLLFSITMEQYIVACFWLMLLLYCLKKRECSQDMFLIGAGGTMLTSLVTVPFFTSSHPLQNGKKWFEEVVYKIGKFFACMLVFGRMDIFCTVSKQLEIFTSFTGEKVLFTDRLKQFLFFVPGCFFAPNAGISTTTKDISWQLTPVAGICWAGVLLLLLCIISAVVNRRKRSTQIAAGWVLFSVVILLLAGWGSQENGMILYSLYFGWAFLVLIFQLADRIDQRLGKPVFVSCLTLFGIGTAICINIPAICELISFAARYYPV